MLSEYDIFDGEIGPADESDRELLPRWVIEAGGWPGGDTEASVADVLCWAVTTGRIPNRYWHFAGEWRPRVDDLPMDYEPEEVNR